ncbi:hypothetical protein AMTR_s00011p00219510 [Amborella trichopoda]|uniref:Uncharacterized protein n=1 Tax=Amborella trichopoda TaxID=13333 RepID=W1NHN7_AMBTC|nr:hypothetical protein AMTR_s00011p00219510 [Amborella trichopoda]
MGEVFRCLGKVSRAALCAIARHLRLRSDVFNQLLDDTSLPPNEASSSVLVASYSRASVQNGKVAVGGGKSGMIYEVEKGLLILIASDCPGLHVCDPNGRWFVADGGSGLGIFYCSQTMPQGNALLDCSPIAAAGHVIPQSFVPITVSQFMDDLSAGDDAMCNNRAENTYCGIFFIGLFLMVNIGPAGKFYELSNYSIMLLCCIKSLLIIHFRLSLFDQCLEYQPNFLRKGFGVIMRSLERLLVIMRKTEIVGLPFDGAIWMVVLIIRLT